MQYRLLKDLPRVWCLVTAGAIMDTEEPRHSLYHVSVDEAQDLVAQGVIAPANLVPCSLPGRKVWHPLEDTSERGEG